MHSTHVFMEAREALSISKIVLFPWKVEYYNLIHESSLVSSVLNFISLTFKSV